MKDLKWTESCRITREVVTIAVGMGVLLKGSWRVWLGVNGLNWDDNVGMNQCWVRVKGWQLPCKCLLLNWEQI